MWQDFDILIVGAGLSGAVLAERYAAIGKKILVLEKRDHIGGNCYDEVNSAGIRVSRYGAHLFHTNDEEVNTYIHRFGEWVPYEHRVLSKVSRTYVPLPVNIHTVNKLFKTDIQTPDEMQCWLDEHQVTYPHQPRTSEELGLSRFGRVLYQKLFLPYTQKQWERHPKHLDASVIGRIPLRLSTDDRYFTDKYQYLPKHGYTSFFEKMLRHPRIKVMLNTDYFDLKEQIEQSNQERRTSRGSSNHPFEKIFYTGPIDQFFEFQQKLGSTLEYRSLRFEPEWYELPSRKTFWQPAAVINYPSLRVPFTRTVEYKHLTQVVDPGIAHQRRTLVIKEYSISHGEPYYPVPNARNQSLYEDYRRHAEQLSQEGIYFVGRLANYKYFNMDQAIKNALELFHQLEGRVHTEKDVYYA